MPPSPPSATTTARPSSGSPGARSTADALRAAAAKGRIDGTLESIGLVLTDAALADCIEQLGDHADNPTSEQLRAVLPGIIERHGLGMTRLMLASTLAGEAAASAVIRDLLKHDETIKLPPVEDERSAARRPDRPRRPMTTSRRGGAR